MPRRVIDRRAFLGTSAGAFICTIGGREIAVRSPQRRLQGRRRGACRRAPAQAEPTGPFPTPSPRRAERKREYWIQARPVSWNFAPTGRDEWMAHRIRGRRTFRAFTYQLYSDGFARAAAAAVDARPGPRGRGRRHARRALPQRGRRISTRRSRCTRTASATRPTTTAPTTATSRAPAASSRRARSSPTRSSARPTSVGVWPYHDHGPNHMLNTFRGLFGAIIVRRARARRPRRRAGPGPALAAAAGHRRHPAPHQCINGRAFAGNTPTIRAQRRPGRRDPRDRQRRQLPHFHIHGHRWRDSRGGPDAPFTDARPSGPNETITARFREDNPGRWLYHCHVFSHQDAGMAGWYLVDA